MERCKKERSILKPMFRFISSALTLYNVLDETASILLDGYYERIIGRKIAEMSTSSKQILVLLFANEKTIKTHSPFFALINQYVDAIYKKGNANHKKNYSVVIDSIFEKCKDEDEIWIGIMLMLLITAELVATSIYIKEYNLIGVWLKLLRYYLRFSNVSKWISYQGGMRNMGLIQKKPLELH